MKLLKIFSSILLLIIFCLGNFFYKAHKSIKEETFKSVLAKKKFYKKVKSKKSEWSQSQIANDFKEFKDKKIKKENIGHTYSEIQNILYKNDMLGHYRILDNKLYKYVDDKSNFIEKDNDLEKALKTLLVVQKMPDVDFLLTIVDGVGEPYFPKNCFFIKDENKQVPILGQAKLEDVYDKYIVLIPDQFSLAKSWSELIDEIRFLNKTIKFEDKVEKAFWRGGLTDRGMPDECFPFEGYKLCPRFKICKCDPQYIDAGLVLPLLTKHSEKIFKQENVIKPRASKKKQLLYKYLPVMDGHMCTSPGYQYRLLSNSVVMKQESNQVQWFYKALNPFEHYIPINNDMSDICEKIKWARANDDKVKSIIKNAQEFALNNLLFEDNYLYLFMVLDNYAKLQDIDFNKMKKEIKNDPNWVCIQSRFKLKMKKYFNELIDIKGKKYGGG